MAGAADALLPLPCVIRGGAANWSAPSEGVAREVDEQ
jgi:hypothetical protein